MLASTIPIPARARRVVTIGIGRSPIVNACAAVRIAAKSTASMRLRPTRSAAIVVCALARRTAGSDPQSVHGDVGRVEPRPDALLGLLDRDREDAVVGTAQREERPGEVWTEHRRDTDQRRAPRQSTTLAEEDRLWRVRCVRTESRKDLEAPGERTRPAAERGARAFVGHIVD